ncbi:hypothetical protein M5K25_006083 [Dendrobium thyrsiflorum]|uniref:Uncharacterized protein n=1 Tax=Dendrobium thyrsiflorum TaxID=117978 RepID=A0ABD0VHK7_DENTH
MMKKMIEMQSKASPTIPRAESKGKKILEEMIRKLVEIQSKTPPTVPITNPNQDLNGIPLAESKRKEIERKEFGENISFHQEPPLRAPRRWKIRFSNGGTGGRQFYHGGGGVVNYYERLFGQGEWTIRGGGRAKPWGLGHMRRMEERGGALQAIDMNQDYYWEEALKMMNLLEEFNEDHGLRPPTILSVHGHIFT